MKRFIATLFLFGTTYLFVSGSLSAQGSTDAATASPSNAGKRELGSLSAQGPVASSAASASVSVGPVVAPRSIREPNSVVVPPLSRAGACSPPCARRTDPISLQRLPRRGRVESTGARLAWAKWQAL